MKTARLSYHRQFPATPISGRAGARWFAWVPGPRLGGQATRPVEMAHPFLHQRPLWCLLTVQFDRLELRFATPEELDQFLRVMSQNPLPSGRSLVPDQAVGRPNGHWLSRLPARAKPWKFRQRLCRHLQMLPEAARFRRFYGDHPVQFRFDGYYDSLAEAVAAQT